VVEAPNEWQPAFDDEMGAALSRMLEQQDAVLLGRGWRSVSDGSPD
jgi:hypothetical protein